jgi:hypothetical protein
MSPRPYLVPQRTCLFTATTPSSRTIAVDPSEEGYVAWRTLCTRLSTGFREGDLSASREYKSPTL